MPTFDNNTIFLNKIDKKYFENKRHYKFNFDQFLNLVTNMKYLYSTLDTKFNFCINFLYVFRYYNKQINLLYVTLQSTDNNKFY